MKWTIGFAMMLLIGACGDSGSGTPRSASGVCAELCSFPSECYVELGVPVPDDNCAEVCEAQIDVVGLACLRSILVTFECVGTCNIEEASEARLQACQDEALAISSACE
ncbi:MAG: hypothetical protein AAF436_10915 [Myxococcota bacterium]